MDRPFAGPGQFVELRLDGDTCNLSAPDFPQPSEVVVTLVFRPPDDDRSVIVLAADCSRVEERRQACPAGRPIARAECIPVNAGQRPAEPLDLTVNGDGRRLQFRFPDTDAFADAAGDLRTLAGPVAIGVTTAAADLPCDLATVDCSELAHDGLLGCVDQLFVNDGSCRAGAAEVDTTFGHFTALPHPNDYQALCAHPDPPCTASASELRFAVDAGGNLLVPVDWRGVLTNEATTPLPRILHGSSAVDAFLEAAGVPIRIPGQSFVRSYSRAGARLRPIFEPTVDPNPSPLEAGFLGSADAPETVLRLARRQATRACIGGADDGALCQHAAQCESATCAPRYLQCTGGVYDGFPCASGDDCAGGSCGGGTRCAADATIACARDEDCPGGECGPSLFEFRGRLNGATTAIIERESTDGGVCQAPHEEQSVEACTGGGTCPGSICVKYRMDALNPAPLEGIAGSKELFTFARREPIEARDLNGDGDTTDLVATVRDRATGERLRFDGGREGRAVARVLNGLVDFPAIASEGDLFAFLEPEPLECATSPDCDRNGDGDVFDTMLRVYRRMDAGPGTAGQLVNLAGGLEIAADAAQLVNGRSLAVSGGRVFYRRPESASVRHRTTRVSVASDGTTANSHSVLSPPGEGSDFWPLDLVGTQLYVSDTGRFVVFASHASNLVPGDDNVSCRRRDGSIDNCVDVFVHDRDPDGNGVFDEQGPGRRSTVRVSVDSDGMQSDGDAFSHFKYSLPSVSCSADGRYVAFPNEGRLVASDTNFRHDVYVRDRDADGDGVFDESEPGAVRTERWSVGASGQQGFGDAVVGFWVAGRDELLFTSDAPNLVPRDPDPVADLFVRTPSGAGAYTTRRLATIVRTEFSVSADGRFVGFASNDPTLVPNDTNGAGDVFVLDRDHDEDGVFDESEAGATRIVRVNVTSTGLQTSGDAFTTAPSISDDGRFATFGSFAPDLVAGDTNGFYDVFLHDRDADGNGVFDEPDGISTRRVTSPNGQHQSSTLSNHLSGDGRYTAVSSGSRLSPDDADDHADVFVYDNLTGLVRRSSITPAGGLFTGELAGPVTISKDGRHVAFAAEAPPDEDPDGTWHVYVESPDPSHLEADLTGDGDVDDTVLEVLDTNAGGASEPVRLCPASEVGVAGGMAAFLRPEAAGATSNPACPWSAGGSLDGDEDLDDDVVHLWTGGTVHNLRCAAQAVALSETWVAAVVAQDGGGARPGFGPVRVHRVADAAGAVCDGPGATWQDLGLRARSVQVGDVVDGAAHFSVAAFIAQSGLLHVFRLPPSGEPQLVLASPAEEFVLGPSAVAFRTLEAKVQDDLNRDGDRDDGVLRVFDLLTGGLHEVRQAVVPCRLAACDPRIPYRVAEDTVTFLTREADQGADLNGDGTTEELVIQVFSLPRGGSLLASAADAEATGVRAATRDDGEADPLASGLADDGKPLFVTAGRCIERLESVSCDPSCGAGTFCDDAECDREPRDCSVTSPCPSPATCERGRCCQPPRCARDHGVCLSDDDCPAKVPCRPDMVSASALDSDGDGLADVLDRCPHVPDPEQRDLDRDGVGDACDSEVCPAEPRDDCLVPTRSRGSILRIDNHPTGARDRLSWRWRMGEATTRGDLGDPFTSDGFRVCLYDGQRLRTDALVPAGGACKGGPCWRETGKRVRYRNPLALPHGIESLVISTGADGKASIALAGKGANLAPPALPLQLPVRMQLHSASGTCWEARFGAAQRNVSNRFIARSD